MEPRPVTAEWAWISKAPGSHGDYGVLASSSGLSDAGGIAGTYVAGVPSSSMPTAASGGPPWVTFGSHLTPADHQLVSVSVQDPWRGQDQALRPIWPRRFFLCRYDDLAAFRVSYRTLWDAVAPITLPRPSRQPAPVPVRPQPLSQVILAIGNIGFNRVAAIAAALLDGPVVVTSTADLRLEDPSATVDRLTVLDAVAALLPYGFRADASATSAVDNTIAHPMRLVLAEYASNGQQAAPLRGPAVTPRSELARDYLAMLSDKERWEGLDVVVAHLWSATEACSFSCPETALEILDGLNRHGYKLRAARNCAESVKLSRFFFHDDPSQVARMWRSPEMDAQTRGKLLRPLLEAEDRDLADALREHWGVVADQYAMLVSYRLDEGDIRSAIRGLTAAMVQPDAEAADRLLRKLVEPPEVPGQTWRQGVVTRAAFLRQCPVPVHGTFAQTRAALRSGPITGWQGQLVGELLFGEIAADTAAERAQSWAAWLSRPAVEGELPGWVAALGYLLAGRDGDEVRESVRALVQQDAIWMATALALAGKSGRVRQALAVPGLADDLVGQAALAGTRPGQEDIRRILATAIDVPLWEHGVDPVAIAAVDAARILLGSSAPGFPYDRTRQEFSRYDEGVRRVLGLDSVRSARPEFAARFLGQVVPVGSPPRLSSGAVWLLQAWSADERLVSVVAEYATVQGAAAAWVRDPRLGCDFWSRLAAVQPGLRGAMASSMLRETIERAIAHPAALVRYVDDRFGLTGSKLALAIHHARRSGMSATQILAVFRDISVEDRTLTETISHRALDDVLREFESLLAHPARAGEDDPAAAAGRQAGAEAALFEFRKLICDGALGAAYGGEFWRFLDRRLRAESAARKRARRRLRRRPWPFTPPGSASTGRQNPSTRISGSE